LKWNPADVSQFSLLGSKQQMVLRTAFENAKPFVDGIFVDGLDSIIRKTDGGAPARAISELERKGYLIPVGEVHSSAGGRPLKRHRIVLNPMIDSFQPANELPPTRLTLRVTQYGRTSVTPLTSEFRLSLEIGDFKLEIAKEE